MNAKVAELGLTDTHFDNPHGLTSDTHKVTAADMAEILRWAMEQPGFMELFTNNEMYIMEPTNMQTEERYFSVSDSVRIGSSSYYVPEVVGSKTGYTDTSRYTYVALGESDGRSFICVTLHSEEKTDRYNDAKILFNYAFEHFTKVEIAPTSESFSVAVYGGNAQLGNATASVNGTSLYLYDGAGIGDISCAYVMDDQYVIGGSYEAYATYTLPETANQEGYSISVPMTISGVDAAIQANVGINLPATLLLLPSVQGGGTGGVLVGVVALLFLAGIGYALYTRVKRPKSRYQKVHRYRH